MSKLQRPSQIEPDRMSHAEKDALVMPLFDLLEGLEQFVDALSLGSASIADDVLPHGQCILLRDLHQRCRWNEYPVWLRTAGGVVGFDPVG